MNHKPIAVIILLVISILFGGCLSESPVMGGKDVVFDLKPSELTIKNGETGNIKIRVANSGKTPVHPYVRFTMNSSDKPYVDFSPEKYDLGSLRQGEDSGFRIVDIKARLPAGAEVKFPVKAEVTLDNVSILQSKDLIIIVTR